MADAATFPTLNTFQWSRPDAENPRLAAPIEAADTTIVVTNAALDEDGNAITGSFLMGIKNSDGYTESVWIPAASSTDGLTFTSCIRGVDLKGLDNTTQNDSTLAVDHEAGDPVFCQQSGVTYEQMIAAMQGTIASGANTWKVGDGTDSDIFWYAYNADTNKPYFGYDKTTNQFVYSNDGVSSTPFGTGAGVTGGDGITVTAGAIAVDLTDTTTFRDSRNGNEQIGVTTAAANGLIAVNFMPTNVQEANTFFGLTDITGTEAETLTDGSDATILHIHDEVANKVAISKMSFPIERWIFTAAGGSATDTGVIITLVTQAANNAFGVAEAYSYGISTTAGISMHNKNPDLYALVRFASNTAQEGFIGLVNANMDGTSLENGAMTLDHAGFVVADGVMYISCADGATQTKTDISATVTNVTVGHEYRITFDGTTATFYVDGASVGTITTNVPDDNLTAADIMVIADATAVQKSVYILSPTILSFDK